MREAIPGEARLHHLSCPQEDYILTKWYVNEGDYVTVGQTVAMIETNSFTLEFCVYDSGIVARRCFSAGEAIPDGAPVAMIDVDEAA